MGLDSICDNAQPVQLVLQSSPGLGLHLKADTFSSGTCCQQTQPSTCRSGSTGLSWCAPEKLTRFASAVGQINAQTLRGYREKWGMIPDGQKDPGQVQTLRTQDRGTESPEKNSYSVGSG